MAVVEDQELVGDLRGREERHRSALSIALPPLVLQGEARGRVAEEVVVPHDELRAYGDLHHRDRGVQQLDVGVVPDEGGGEHARDVLQVHLVVRAVRDDADEHGDQDFKPLQRGFGEL